MKLIPLFFLFTLATAAAEVPSLINYQGRLVGADGAAQSGQKSFLLQVFGAANGGSLLYREEIGNITLGEGGVYSFQFGGSGTSNTQVTETIGTGGEAVLYQQVLSNLPVVAGSVSVSDGTYTWSQSGGSSNEDDFSGSFSTNLNRITVNYFSGAPNDGRSIDVTYRYQAEGITGALSSGGEHWLQLTIDGDVQATRERVLAVPFALRAGGLVGGAELKTHNYYYYWALNEGALGNRPSEEFRVFTNNPSLIFGFPIPANCKRLIDFTASAYFSTNEDARIELHVYSVDIDGNVSLVAPPKTIELERVPATGFYKHVVSLNQNLDPTRFHYLAFGTKKGTHNPAWQTKLLSFPRLTYEE